ncbi:MAG: ABC transporter ATP-binding protein [bacterium]|jgi:subfamily B ATP-binding cassette protein MsbA|nr:ABC transporter ATP-binding protein [bacterium]
MLRLIRQFIPYLRGVRLHLALGLLMMVVASLLAGVNISLIYPFFEGVFGGAATDPPTERLMDLAPSIKLLGRDLWQAGQADSGLRDLAGRALDDFMARHARHTVLLLLCGTVLALAVLKFIALYLYRVFFVQVEQTMIRRLRDHLFTHLQGLSLDVVQRFRQGELISRLINDVMVVRSLTITKVADLLSNLLQCLVYLGLALFVEWRLTLVSVLVLAPAVAGFQAIGRKLRTYSRRAQEHMSRVSESLSENLQGFRVVQAFFAREREIQRFQLATASYFRRTRKLEWVAGLSTPFGEFASVVVAVFMLWYGGLQALSGDGLSGSAFLTFLAALLAMLHPLKIVARTWNDLQRGTGAGDRIMEVFDLRSSLATVPNPAPVAGLREGIELRGVSLLYGEKAALQEVGLTLRRGELVALVGASGSGKTTLANLVLRLVDPTTGGIYLDGRDIRELELGSYRRLFGVVGQDTWLFQLSVAENVCYPEACPDPAVVARALALANAEGFVREMGGLDALVQEGGSNLSGGQRQRLAIARAVSRRPEVLVFDEATSALDSESEQLVQSALERSISNRTALVIAHRLSTIIRADRIVCLKDGRIEGIGRHEELLRTSEEYRKLYELQFSAQEES